MDHDISDLRTAWDKHDVKSTIEILSSIKPSELDKNIGFSLIRGTIGHHDGNRVSNTQLEILRLYLNKRAEYHPYDVNDSTMDPIEQNFLTHEEVELLCKQILANGVRPSANNISPYSVGQKTRLIKLLMPYFRGICSEDREQSEIMKLIEKLQVLG